MQRRFLTLTTLGLWLALSGLAAAADLAWADITQVYRQVNVLDPGTSARKAAIGERIQGETAVATGRSSRAELKFNDATLLRLGANTTFSLASARTLDLKEGAVLIQTAPGGGGVNIRAGGVTAAITGSMGLFSMSPPSNSNQKDQYLVKLISIHGNMSVEINGVVYELEPFEMIFFNVDLDGNLVGTPSIVSIDGRQLVRTSQLINGFANNDLIDDPEILAELNNQQGEKNSNSWTVVTKPSGDQTPGLPGDNTIGLGSLINKMLMRPEMPQEMTPPPTTPPPTPPTPPMCDECYYGEGDGIDY